MASAAILDKKKFQRLDGSGGSNCIIFPNFVEIGQTVAEIWRYFIFLSLGFVLRVFGSPSLGGLYRRAKFGWNRRRSFEDM